MTNKHKIWNDSTPPFDSYQNKTVSLEQQHSSVSEHVQHQTLREDDATEILNIPMDTDTLTNPPIERDMWHIL